MKPIFAGAARDAEGRMILGDHRAACAWCGSPAEATISACNRVAWWHPPTDCCRDRRAATAKARATPPPPRPPATPPPGDPNDWWRR